MTEKLFTEKDLNIAEKLGGITAVLTQISDNLNRHIANEDRDHSALWKKVDDHTEKLSDHSGFIKWIIGIGVTLQAVVGLTLAWWKRG